MEVIATYSIDGDEYEMYLAASGDYCVSVSRPFKERKDYNIGSKEDALAFILSEYEVK